MSIVMGLDQHRGQVTGEWIDTETGEVRRARVTPADGAGVRKFVERFRGRELEVAPEATTGWRFVVEEFRRVGATMRAYARRQAGCKALMAHYGIGELCAVTILAELGDCTRFSSSRQAVRYAGMDITVHQSDQRRAPGHLSRQGPPALRWALFEAAQQTRRRTTSPDRDYYDQAADRIGGNGACLSFARKLLRRSYHTLRELGEEALQPA